MARAKSASGLSEIWFPTDLVSNLKQLRADFLMVYAATADMRGNSTGYIDAWVATEVAKHAGVSERTVAAAHKRLIALKLHTVDSGPKGKGAHPRVHVRVGTGNASIRVPVVAVWAVREECGQPKDNPPRWGGNSGHALRATLALLNVMDHHHPTTHLPHEKVAKRVGLSSTVYRQGFTILAASHYVDVHERWLAPGQRGGPIAGVQRDSNRVTFDWAILVAEVNEVKDRQALRSLADAHRTCIEAVNSAFVSTKHVENPAGDHVENPAGDHVENPAGILKSLGLQFLPSSVSSPSTPAAAAATKPSPAINHATKEEEQEEAGQGQEMPRLTLMPAPQLTIADVLNAKCRDDAAVLIRATVDRAGGWQALNDQEWGAATIGAIHYAPGDHALPITLKDARSLTPALLERKAQGFTPLALAEQLVSAHLNTNVRDVAAVLSYRLACIPGNAWHGSIGDPNALLVAAQMTDAKHAAAARGSASGNRPGTSSRNPTGRDRFSNEGWSKTFG